MQWNQYEPLFHVVQRRRETLVQASDLGHAREEDQNRAILVLIRDELHQHLYELHVYLLLVHRL